MITCKATAVSCIVKKRFPYKPINMIKRHQCEQCNYPIKVCVCDDIKTFDVPLRLVILQHPSEVKHAKNTARLVPLCISQCEIHVGESEQDFVSIIPTLENPYLIYPSEISTPIESMDQSKQSPKTLVFIDATWKKAYKIFQLNSWLHSIPSLHFVEVPDNQYHIRKTALAHSLSTLEAIAYALQKTTSVDPSPLLTALDAMQNHRQRFIENKHE